MAAIRLVTNLPCANLVRRDHGGGSLQCPNIGVEACPDCLLVMYCSKGCQAAHFDKHKALCHDSPLMKTTWRPDWEEAGQKPPLLTSKTPQMPRQAECDTRPESNPLAPLSQQPADDIESDNDNKIRVSLPALDVVKYLENEANGFPDGLYILFASSGNLRHVIDTVANLPNMDEECIIVINDTNSHIVARNIILLLIALLFPPNEAAPIMLHMWYSAFLPCTVLSTLQKKLVPYFEAKCMDIQDDQSGDLLVETWDFDKRSISLAMEKEFWFNLLSYLQVPANLSKSEAMSIMHSVTNSPARKDDFDNILLNLPPPRRLCSAKFCLDGILLPFGNSRQNFDTPNPTLFQIKGSWATPEFEDPLQAWADEEVKKQTSAAKDDIYGALYMHVQGTLVKFCEKLEGLDIRFQIFQVQEEELPSMMKDFGIEEGYFDRIDLLNLADRSYPGLEESLRLYGPLLKQKDENPHASMLTLFGNAIEKLYHFEPAKEQDKVFDAQAEHILKLQPDDSLVTMEDNLKRFRDLLLSERQTRGRYLDDKHRPYNAELTQLELAYSAILDRDGLFNDFMKKNLFGVNGKAAGLQMKKIHTLTKCWPFCLESKDLSQEHFGGLVVSGLKGLERYVEWEVWDGTRTVEEAIESSLQKLKTREPRKKAKKDNLEASDIEATLEADSAINTIDAEIKENPETGEGKPEKKNTATIKKKKKKQKNRRANFEEAVHETVSATNTIGPIEDVKDDLVVTAEHEPRAVEPKGDPSADKNKKNKKKKKKKNPQAATREEMVGSSSVINSVTQTPPDFNATSTSAKEGSLSETLVTTPNTLQEGVIVKSEVKPDSRMKPDQASVLLKWSQGTLLALTMLEKFPCPEVEAASKVLLALIAATKAQTSPALETIIIEAEAALAAVIKLECTSALELAMKELREKKLKLVPENLEEKNEFVEQVEEKPAHGLEEQDFKPCAQINVFANTAKTGDISENSSPGVKLDGPSTAEKVISYQSHSEESSEDWPSIPESIVRQILKQPGQTGEPSKNGNEDDSGGWSVDEKTGIASKDRTWVEVLRQPPRPKIDFNW